MANNKTAGKTAKRCAARREARRANGTAAEVRKARLMPWERDLLAISLRDVRQIYGGDSRRAEAADRRQSALRHNSTAHAYLHIPTTGCTPALLIRMRAAARFAGRSEADFVADALTFAVESAIEAANGTGLPYTQHERDALARLGENPEEDETELQRIAAAIFGKKARLTA